MRKTLFAMVGLLAIGVWALPAFADDYDLPLVSEPVPMENRAGRLGAMARGDEAQYKGTLSGTLIKQAQVASTTWFLYPNACNDRANGPEFPANLGTWSVKTAIVADSLNGYNPITQNHGYGISDLSLKEILWHVTDGSDALDGAPVVLDGARSLWCGKYDPNWVVQSGYPNLTFQILFIDTDPIAQGGGSSRITNGDATYSLSWQGDINTEYNYDFLYLIGAGEGDANRDAIGNSRARLDAIRNTGSDGAAELLITATGAQNTNQTLAYTSGGVRVDGDFSGESVTNWTMTGIPSADRGLYFLFYADCLYSGEDGLWPDGHGQILDNITATDATNGSVVLYANQPDYDEAAAMTPPDPNQGNILVATGSGDYLISARVAPGVGTVWSIQAGNNLPTSDFCSPQKALPADKMFLGADASSKLTLNNQNASVVTCSFPVPPATASVVMIFGEYLDLPRQSGFVQNHEYQVYKDGLWSNWLDPTEGSVRTGALQAWTRDGDELAAASTADSVKFRLDIQCINFFAIDHLNCNPVQYGIIYDDLRLQVVTGVPAPLFSIFVGRVPQSTFVDGTYGDVGCLPATIAAGKCWPGVRGSDALPVSGPVHDNFNNPYGDSSSVNLQTGLRKNGMGINWRYGYDKAIQKGNVIARMNGNYVAAIGPPMWIYRIYDPATTNWSPWDSSELDVNSAALSGPDTIVVNNAYRFDWPPRDKSYTNTGGTDIGPTVDANLPGVSGGWSLNGHTKFSQVPFLPRGTRLQYYFKAVDVGGGVSYQFATDALALEVADLPTLPGSAIKAPDIVEFDVLPGKYPAGGGQLAGATGAKILDLDGSYSSWSAGYDPVTQALRAMGVRADRFRFLQALDNGGNFGGHEFPGNRVTRLSNYFPNDQEYAIKDLMAGQYNIMIQSSHLRSSTIFYEEDAHLLSQWWNTDTGINGGDRGVLGTGDAMFNALLNASKSFPDFAEQVNLAQNVFGVASCIDAWTGANTVQYPTIDDGFLGGGAGLLFGTVTYPVDGGCPSPNRFDGLTKVGLSTSQVSAKFPGGVSEVAGIATSIEKDAGGSTDNDRNKALAYGFSIQFIRSAGINPTASNYVHSGVQNRMRVLFKFITGIRKTTTTTTPCWPCPANFAEMTSNWATATGFQTTTYGDLFPVQDFTQATGVELTEAPKVNRLEGNFPNPFNPETAIRFSAATPGKVTIRIFNVAGRLVNTLTKNVTETGLNEIRWNGKSSDGRNMASGLYFYRIHFANGQQSEAKMTMLK
jgi:FlgD Ig-like domain